MRTRMTGFLMAALAVATFEGTASACHTCQKTPCVLAPVALPAYQCVTEMVPYTVYKQRKRIEFETVTETIMVKVPDTTYVERQRCVKKPVWDTQYVQRQVSFCRPVSETTIVDQQYTVCKPVSTTRQVTEYCMQPSTSLVTVPVVAKKCGHVVACGCQTVAQTTYTPVPVVKDVVETHLVSETLTRKVPVSTTHLVRETKVETVPIRTCRIVPEIVTDRIPVTTFHCEPKTITRQIPHPVCETVAETCYRAVKRMVPVVYAPAPAPAPAPSSQAASSQQG
jgi:YTV